MERRANRYHIIALILECCFSKSTHIERKYRLEEMEWHQLQNPQDAAEAMDDLPSDVSDALMQSWRHIDNKEENEILFCVGSDSDHPFLAFRSMVSSKAFFCTKFLSSSDIL